MDPMGLNIVVGPVFAVQYLMSIRRIQDKDHKTLGKKHELLKRKCAHHLNTPFLQTLAELTVCT